MYAKEKYIYRPIGTQATTREHVSFIGKWIFIHVVRQVNRARASSWLVDILYFDRSESHACPSGA